MDAPHAIEPQLRVEIPPAYSLTSIARPKASLNIRNNADHRFNNDVEQQSSNTDIEQQTTNSPPKNHARASIMVKIAPRVWFASLKYLTGLLVTYMLIMSIIAQHLHTSPTCFTYHYMYYSGGSTGAAAMSVIMVIHGIFGGEITREYASLSDILAVLFPFALGILLNIVLAAVACHNGKK